MTTLTETQKQFVRDNYKKISGIEMSRSFGCNKSTIYRFRKLEGLIVTPADTLRFAKLANTGKTTFTAEEDKYITDNYLILTVEAISKNIKRSECGINLRLKRLGLVIPPELVAERRKQGCFKKGNVPDNKGKKQSEYMSADAIEKTKQTRFKTGQKPHNTLPENTEIKRKDKNGITYTFIKPLGHEKIIPKQRYVWEQYYNKKIPEKHNVIFADGNRENFEISNLKLLSNKELMLNNSIQNYPEELKELMQLKGAITRQINKNHDTRIKK